MYVPCVETKESHSERKRYYVFYKMQDNGKAFKKTQAKNFKKTLANIKKMCYTIKWRLMECQI